MLLWQLKNARNRHLLWLKLLACSFTMHLLFVGMLFFGYRDSKPSHTFTMHNHAINTRVAVVLIPTMQKTNVSATARKTVVALNVEHDVKITKQKKAATKLTQLKPEPIKKVIPKKPAPAKVVQKKTTPAKATPIKTEPSFAKATADRPKKTASAKVEPLKTEPVKIEPVKTEPKKATPAKVESSFAKATADRPAATNPVAKEMIETPIQSHEQPVPDGPVTIEVPYNQAREFYQQEALRKELSRHWTPPHGISDTSMCEITTYVGNNGVVTDSVITQSSGILMYDVSARAAILAMDLPRWTWGTSFTITFKP